MNQSLLAQIATVGHKYETEGFFILGVFSSVARDDAHEGSDIDILYRCDAGVSKNHSGLRFFALYEQVKADLETCSVERSIWPISTVSMRSDGNIFCRSCSMSIKADRARLEYLLKLIDVLKL